MSKEDKIKELFAEKLGAHEAPVNPELWNAIASQIGTAAAVTSTGLSVVVKAIIGISAASVIGVGAYFLTRDNEAQPQKQKTAQLSAEDTSKQEKQEEVPADSSEKTEEKNGSPAASQVVPLEHELTFGEKEKNNLKDTKDSDNSEPSKKRSEFREETIDRTSAGSNPPVATPPFTNQPTPNLVGEKPAPAPVQPKSEKKEKEPGDKRSGNIDRGEVQEEEAIPSFEITRLPNIYTLNANGYFSIGYEGEYSDFQITIMDDRNNVIFNSNQPDFEWRGTDLSGNQIEPGKYIYIITAKDKNGKAINKYSLLTVINQ